jgi:hypothetical protein
MFSFMFAFMLLGMSLAGDPPNPSLTQLIDEFSNEGWIPVLVMAAIVFGLNRWAVKTEKT